MPSSEKEDFTRVSRSFIKVSHLYKVRFQERIFGFKFHFFMATDIMPPKTRTAPKMKRAFGISVKMSTPNRVAVMGSKRANVAVSNDFRLKREEKYRVCARAVGKKPSATSMRRVSKLIVKNIGGDPTNKLATSTVRVDNT